MEAIKRTIKTPPNREVTIKIPEYVPANEPVEIILLIRDSAKSSADKINQLKAAMNDPLFLEDMKTVTEDFQAIDSEAWED